MLKEGQRIRNKDGRIIKIITPIMTFPICYLVEFESHLGIRYEEKIVDINHPEALERPSDVIVEDHKPQLKIHEV